MLCYVTVGSKYTVFVLFYFILEGNFPSTSPRGAYIWRGDLTEGFCVTGLGGPYIWRGLYMEGLIFEILRHANKSSRVSKNFLYYVGLINIIIIFIWKLLEYKCRGYYFGHVTYGENWHMTTLLLSLTGTCVKKLDIVIVLGRLPFDRKLRKFRMQGRW